ncbi:MAG: efflux RND transporter permease subunit [Myxococcota bacterium]
MKTSPSERGPIAWMAGHPVAANLLMALLIVGGLLSAQLLRRELMPDVNFDSVVVWVPYPGATPEQVEVGVAIPIEQALLGVDGVDSVTASIEAGWTWMRAELEDGAEMGRTLDAVKSEIDRLQTLPAGIERPSVSIMRRDETVSSLVLHGPASLTDLRGVAEEIRDELIALPNISKVQVRGIPDPQIHIEVAEEVLRRHGLRIQDVADAIRGAAVEIPGGRLEVDSGEILLHVDQRKERGFEFEDIVVLSRSDGTSLRLRDIARVVDGVQDSSWGTFYDGERAARISVFRVGDQRPLRIAEAVDDYRLAKALPEGMELSLFEDKSESYAGRIDLLRRNALIGLGLMLLLLGLFLEPGLAFWVTLGIPVSFLGALCLLPGMGVSINMISLFGFIVALGIVVDDAIVVGEAIHKHRQDGLSRPAAALAGAREVAHPVTFSVITTVIAFLPIAFVPSEYGRFFIFIPFVVIPIFLISLVESLFVLPAHLSSPRRFRLPALLEKGQRRFSQGLESFIERVYAPSLDAALKNWTTTLAISVASLMLAYGVLEGGHLRFNFFPKIEKDIATAGVQYPVGTPNEQTAEALRRMTEAAREVAADLASEGELIRGVLATRGRGFAVKGSGSQWGSHVGNVQVHLTPMGERPISTKEFVRRWREKVGRIPGTDNLAFQYSSRFAGEGAIGLELSHPDSATLEVATERLSERMREVDGLVDVDGGLGEGRGQLDFELTAAGRDAGLTYADFARQLRNHFYGAEVMRLIRGQSELKVFVRRPAEERGSEHDLEQMMVRLPGEGMMALRDAVRIEREAADSRRFRRDGRRIMSVSADVVDAKLTADEALDLLSEDILPRLQVDFTGLDWSLGREKEKQDLTLAALEIGALITLLAMFGLLAIASRSYFQPLLVVAAVPFGVVGALAGHLLLGFDLSLVSILGMVALAGIVVNDSLVLVAAVNDARTEGMAILPAVRHGARRRFRPIVLTSLTTFFGLMPMIFETSEQARFLSPMAVSLGFGVLFVTVFALFVVPVLYVGVERLRTGWDAGTE